MWPILKLVTSVAVVAVLLWMAGVGKVRTLLEHANLAWLLVAGACLTLSTGLMAWRWRRLGQHYGLRITYVHALREYYVSQLINQTVPGGVVGDASRAVRARHQVDLKRAALSVVAERMMGQVAMLLIMALGCLIAVAGGTGTNWPVWYWCVPVDIVVVVAVLHFAGRSNRHVAMWVDMLRQGRMMVLSGVIAMLLTFSLFVCARSIGAVLPLTTLVTLMPLILTAMLIPLSIGGWGWREGAAAALFPLAGATAAEGVATGIVYGAMLLITSLPAVFWVLTPTSLASFDLSRVTFRQSRKPEH